MKKLLLTAAAAMMMASAANAYEVDLGNVRHNPAAAPKFSKIEKNMQRESRATSGYTLRFHGALYNWLLFDQNNAYDLVEYIAVPAEIATQLAGNKVTTISFSVSLDDYATMTTTIPGTVFVTENIEDINNFTVSKSVTIHDSYLYASSGRSEYQSGTFASTNQYEIKEDTPFYFGVSFSAPKASYPIAVDQGPASVFSGFMDVYQNGEYLGFLNIGEATGRNLFLSAKTVGDKDGIENVFILEGATLGEFSLPIISAASEAEDVAAEVYINNFGSNELTSVDYSFAFGDGDFVSMKSDISVPGVTESSFPIALPGCPVGRDVVNLSIDSINGVAVGYETALPFFNLGASEGYPRKFVVEEGTGTWCGWCPRGIVGMDYMAANYPDTFVGIAVHSGDKFETDSYVPFIEEFFSGFPTCIMNRDPMYADIDPNQEYLEIGLQLWETQRSPVAVTLDVNTVTDTVANTIEKLVATAHADFAIDNAASYTFAFVILEDSLVGKQTNYYAGGNYGVMDGWEKKGQSVTWEYMHTAVDITDAFGIESSILNGVAAGQTYDYTAELPLGNITDLKNTSIVALVMDVETGVVLNAAKVHAADYTDVPLDGINSIEADAAGHVEYYNIQGLKVTNPQRGQIYIRVQNGAASKVRL